MMATPFSRRRCPYCGHKFFLGRCPIVATNKEKVADGDAGPRPVSGAETFGTLGDLEAPDRWPIVARPPFHIRRGHRLRDTIRALATCWRLSPVNRVGDFKDLPARACVACEHPLPVDIDTRRIVTIAVLGTKSAGKTHYLASAMYQASRMQGLQRVGCVEFEPDERTALTYHDMYFEPLFVRKQQLESTNSEEHIRFNPLVYRVQFADSEPCSLLLHDISGEMLRNRADRARYAQFIYRADGAIFLIDPDHLTLDSDQAQLMAETGAGTYNQADLFTSWVNDLSSEIPIALTLSKSDVVAPVDPATHDLFRRDPPPDGDDWGREMSDISKRVEELLEALNAHDLLAATRRRGGQISFHAVAALGHPPGEDGTVGQVRPRRCLDPLITLLTRIPGVVSPRL